MEPPAYSRLSLMKEYLGDDPIQIKEMVQLFLETYPIDIHELEQACLDRNYSILQKTAHRLKSSVQLFNLDDAREILVTIEMSAMNEGAFSTFLPLIQQFKSLMETEVKNIQTEIQLL